MGEVKFELRHPGWDGTISANICPVENLSGRRIQRCKGPEAEKRFHVLEE